MFFKNPKNVFSQNSWKINNFLLSLEMFDNVWGYISKKIQYCSSYVLYSNIISLKFIFIQLYNNHRLKSIWTINYETHQCCFNNKLFSSDWSFIFFDQQTKYLSLSSYCYSPVIGILYIDINIIQFLSFVINVFIRLIRTIYPVRW